MRPLLYLWALPNTAIGLVLLCTLYFPERILWVDGALEVVPLRRRLIGGPWVGGQTFGWVIFYRDIWAQMDVELARHERVHVRDGLIGGPFFLVAYVALFAWEWGKRGFRPSRWQEAYRANWFERRAYGD
jgi:hypothetical protein